MRILLALTLATAMNMASAYHMDVYAAYCQNPASPSQVRLVGMLIEQDGETVLKWIPDRSLSPAEQQKRLESKVQGVIPEWATHIFRVRKTVIGTCRARHGL